MGRIGASREAGFSLIELVAVVAVLAVLSVSVALTTGRSRDAAQDDAARFARTVAQLQNTAVLQGHAVGLDLGLDRWQTMAASPQDQQRYAPSAEPVVLAGEVRYLIDGVPLTADAPDGQVDLYFLADGRSHAVEASFIGERGITLCRTDGWRPMECGVR